MGLKPSFSKRASLRCASSALFAFMIRTLSNDWPGWAVFKSKTIPAKAASSGFVLILLVSS